MELPLIRIAPSRFKHEIGEVLLVRGDKCINCGTCASLCPYGVHERKSGYNRISKPVSYRCKGFSCESEAYYCISNCPRQVLTMEGNPGYVTLGDFRWTQDTILGTWQMAETGKPLNGERYEFGDTGGGFDQISINFPENPDPVELSEIDLGLDLNHREGEKIRISLPFYGGGMSYGSTSRYVMTARARAAKAWNTFTCTGEGGYPDDLTPFDDHVITQVATGLFGVREETIQRVKFVEFKYAQGAKPGLGGHLLGDKVTSEVARMREAVEGSSLFSPFPFHSVYSIEDHKKHIDWIRTINPEAIVSAKVSTPTDVDMVAIGCYYAGANIVHIDGGYGGTGAAPAIAKKNIAMPIEYAIPKVHNFLTKEGVRDKMTLIASGGIRNAHDLIKAIALGADGVVIGTAELVALGCVRCGNCESRRGCPRGITTTDPELYPMVDVDWATQRLINLFLAWRLTIMDLLAQLEVRSVKELVGRTDLLRLR